MTKPRDPETLLAAYLTDGMNVLPDRVARAVLEEAHRTRQRTVFRPRWARSTFKTALGASVVAVLALGGALFVIQRGLPTVGGPSPTPGPSAIPSQVAVAVPSAIPRPTPAATPAASAGPTATPFVVAGGRRWTVTVINQSSDPATLFLAEDTASGMGPQCGTVTPAIVPAGVTTRVTFLLPPKSVTDCWIWLNPTPDGAGSFFQTSDAPLKGHFLVQPGGQSAWGGQ